MNKTEARDLAATAAYLIGIATENESYFQAIDKVLDVAEKFVKRYPHNTDWEKMGEDWESFLTEFYRQQTEYDTPVIPVQDCNFLPVEIRNILESFDENEDSYKECFRIYTELNANGYTIEYGLDGELFDLRKNK
jgi:hypothetical protein